MRFDPKQWLRRERHPKRSVLVGAHRGGGSLGPENTLATALRGYLAGADFWELDVQQSADGHLVVVHDDDLRRTSNACTVFPERAPWRVHQFLWKEIRRLDFGSWFVAADPFQQHAAGAIDEDAAASFLGENAPSLAEALLVTRALGWRVNIEIKDQSGTASDATIVARVIARVRRLGMERSVLVSSFQHSYLEQVRRLAPEIATGVLVEEMPKDPVALVRRLAADALHPPAAAVDAGLVREMRTRGIFVNVWTVNDRAAMERLKAAGVTGIISDFPQLLSCPGGGTDRPG